jgi:uncharacterized damage-inducible protein DinB
MTYLEVFADQYRDTHRELLDVIHSLPDGALNWVAYAGGNSIAVLVTHILGNQLETLRVVRGQPSSRTRSAEFEVDQASAADLRALLVEAQAIFEELTPRITPEELEATVTRPSAVRVIERSGLYTLNHSVVHAREHLGQIWMTRDLWNLRFRPDA